MNLLLDSAWKSTFVIAGAWIAASFLRRASADVRHRIWLAAIVAVAALPALLSIPARLTPLHLSIGAQMASVPAPPARSMPSLFTAWAAGAALAAGRFVLGLAYIAWLTRRARMIDGVRYSGRVSTPLTWGKSIVLPAEAFGWTEAQRDVAIRHERAHIERRDWLWQTLARMMSAVFWFQPLMWIAAAMLRKEAEQAVDDRVLASGTEPHEYASHLAAVARRIHAPAPAVAVAMVRRNTLESRVRGILDPMRRRTPAGRGARALIALGAAALLAPFALSQNRQVHKVGEPGLTAPRVLSKVDPAYTQDARDAHVEGTVVLSTVISDDGRARDIRVTRSLDPGLDQNAIAAVMQWNFEPGRKDGKPVPVQAAIEVNFRLK